MFNHSYRFCGCQQHDRYLLHNKVLLNHVIFLNKIMQEDIIINQWFEKTRNVD